MAKVSEVIKWLSARDPEEDIALTGWWYRDDVENNNNVTLTDEQWIDIVTKYEHRLDADADFIDEIVYDVLEDN